MCQVLHISAATLIARGADKLGKAAAREFQQYLTRRLAGEPVAYIVGRREFWTMSLRVTPDTLIPRPETERLVELALEHIPTDAQWTIADLGTGSGAIALAVASERPGCQLVATDQSVAALEIAADNAERLGIKNIRFVHASWLDFEHHQRYPMILSNPPYIEESDPHLKQGDVRFEPQSALASGQNGLNDIKQIAEQAAKRLEDSGYLLMECGYRQGSAALALLKGLGYQRVKVENDLAGRDRVLVAQMSAPD